MKVKLLKAKDFIAEKIIWAFLSLFGAWLIFVLGLMFYSIYLEITDNQPALQDMSNQFSWKFDGTFKNSPGNVWYEAEDHIWVESVTNEVKIGKLAGNRKLEFGVKNILEEYLQERGLDLSPDATRKLKVSIIFLDVLTTKKNISVFHSGEETVVIRLKGILHEEGKKDKEVIVEESSSEISMSTLIVDEGGKFNQTSLSNALKKGSDKLITKLLGEKK
jgi:hypothetical protein